MFPGDRPGKTSKPPRVGRGTPRRGRIPLFVRVIRRTIVVVLVGISIFAGFVGRAEAAQQSTRDAENTLTADINQERTSRGLGTLSVAADLVAWAEHHSADMAAAGRPYHDPNIQTQI